MAEGLPNMGNTCYVNASIQAMRSVINVVCPATEDDGPLLRALRRFVDARDEAGAAAFLDVVGEALGRDLRTPSDSAEFLQDLVSLLALENGAVERAFQSAWVPVSAALLCSTCGAESPAPEVTVGAEACAKEYVLTVPAVPDSRNVTLSEALPLLEAQHTLALTHAAGSEPVCPKCGANCCKVNVRRRLEPAEVLVLNFANPFATTVSPALQQSLLGETYALVSITGFKDGHYTALVNSGYGWRLCDDRYTGDHSIETYLMWSHATMAVFQRTIEVTLRARFRGKAPARVQVGGTFSNWQLLDAAWDNDTSSGQPGSVLPAACTCTSGWSTACGRFQRRKTQRSTRLGTRTMHCMYNTKKLKE